MEGGLGACLAKENKTIFSRKYLFISLINVTFATENKQKYEILPIIIPTKLTLSSLGRK